MDHGMSMLTEILQIYHDITTIKTTSAVVSISTTHGMLCISSPARLVSRKSDGMVFPGPVSFLVTDQVAHEERGLPRDNSTRANPLSCPAHHQAGFARVNAVAT